MANVKSLQSWTHQMNIFLAIALFIGLFASHILLHAPHFYNADTTGALTQPSQIKIELGDRSVSSIREAPRGRAWDSAWLLLATLILALLACLYWQLTKRYVKARTLAARSDYLMLATRALQLDGG
jgi:hypothetical protein